MKKDIKKIKGWAVMLPFDGIASCFDHDCKEMPAIFYKKEFADDWVRHTEEGLVVPIEIIIEKYQENLESITRIYLEKKNKKFEDYEKLLYK